MVSDCFVLSYFLSHTAMGNPSWHALTVIPFYRAAALVEAYTDIFRSLSCRKILDQYYTTDDCYLNKKLHRIHFVQVVGNLKTFLVEASLINFVSSRDEE